MNVLDMIEKFWGLIVAIGGGVAAYFRWRSSRQKSTKMLYDELEKLKQKVILQVAREVEHASELAEKQRIIDGLRLHCPDCYKSFLKNYDQDENAKS